MPTLFRIEARDITGLDSLQLTKLLKLLLHCEARNNGIAGRAVEVALNINVPDGGEDGRIQWNGSIEYTDFLPFRFVLFQNKASTTMGPAEYAREILKQDGTMKHKVEEVLDSRGAYIIFTSQLLNRQQKDERINLIRNELSRIGKGYAGTALIDIYDASTIEGWVNNYITAIVAVSNWVGRPLERGLKTWEEWCQDPEYQRFPFIADDDRTRFITELRGLLIKPRSCARIMGLSGLGKTRLAFEAFNESGNQDDLSSRVVYWNARANPDIQGLITDWIRFEFENIIVVDDCEISLHERLKQEIKRSDSKLSLLTLDYNLNKTNQTEIIHLKRLSDECIKQILDPVYGAKIGDIDRIIRFAQGFPQMAVLLADARLDQDPQMGRLNNDELANKILWGGDVPTANDEAILKGCALFDRFGIDDEVSLEYKFIADFIVKVDLDSFYECLKRFEARGIIDRRGRYGSLVPKPLAIRLAAEWWSRTRPERQREIIFADMPAGLVESFCEQISLLDFLPEFKSLTEELCGPQSPFGQAEVILSERGSRLFRAFVEVNHDATSKALLTVLKAYTKEELLKIEDDVRRNLVWALEKLCFHASCFENSSTSLLLLASAENEDWSNNASGIFKQLFQIYLSGTKAPPTLRMRIIDIALQSQNNSMRKLAVEALERALGTFGWSRSGGAEYQGSGEPLKDWHPVIYQEIFDYWEQALDRLSNLVINNDSLAQHAKIVIGSHIRGLMQYGRYNLLDGVIKRIVEHDGSLWPVALNNIKQSISFDSTKMPEKGRRKLDEWVSLLIPSRLEDRLSLIVSHPSFEHEEDDDGNYIDVASNNAKALAEEIAQDINSIIPFIRNLIIGEQRQAYYFGKSLIEAAVSREPLLSSVIQEIDSIEDPNCSLLFGILNGIYNVDPSRWNDIVKIFYERDNLNKYYANAIVTGTVSFFYLDLLVDLICKNKIEPEAANVLVYGRPLRNLDDHQVVAFIEKIAATGKSAAWVALDILYMHCHGIPENWENCKLSFKQLIISLELDNEYLKKHNLEIYHWRDISMKLLKDDDPVFASDLAKQIVANCTDELDLEFIWNSVQPILRVLFQKFSKDVWPIFTDAIQKSSPLERYRFEQLLNCGSLFDSRTSSILSNLPSAILEEWCRRNPDFAPRFIAQSIDVLIDLGERYQILPEAQFLLDNFGDDEKVLSALSSNLSSFGWTGSMVPLLRKEISALEDLRHHNNNNVRSWASRRIDYLNRLIRQESREDEERDWGIH